MNSVVVCVGVFLLSVVAGQGIPSRICPKGEHPVLYCPQKAEPDCNIHVVHEMNTNSGLCDISQCFCNRPTVRNLKTGKCVQLTECP